MGLLSKVIVEVDCNEKEARLICLDLIASAVSYPAWNPDPIAAIKEYLTDYANAFPGASTISIKMKSKQWAEKRPGLKIVGGRQG